MANVSATIGANTQQAEGSIGRLLSSLRKLRQESQTGVGMKVFASGEVQKLSEALNNAISAAGALNNIDLSRFDQSLRNSAQLLQRNADNYLRAQRAMGNNGVAGRFAQQMGAGGNPLNPNFGQMFPNLQGQALQRQMDFYFRSMLRNTGMGGSFGGGFSGGGRGGTTGTGSPAPGDQSRDADGPEMPIIGKLKKLAAAYLGFQAVKNLTSKGLAAARDNTDAEDTLLRMTLEGGGLGNRIGLPMGNSSESLATKLENAGKRYGLSGTEAMRSAQVYAHAAQQADRSKVISGFEASAGYARAYGLNINQSANALGGLQRVGAIGSSQEDQNKFLLKMAQTLKSTGMTANADEAVNDLADTVNRYISHDLSTPNQNKIDEFASLRATTYTMSALSGQHGQSLLSRYDENMRSDKNDARNVMMASALQRYGINNPYSQRRIQAEGAGFDLSTVPGYTGPKGLTYGELVANEAHRIATDASGGGGGTTFDRESMELTIMGNLTDESIPGSRRMYEIYQQRKKDQAQLVDRQAQLARYGLTLGGIKNTSGVKDIVDLLGMDKPEDIRAVADRYKDRLDLSDLNGTGGSARADITKLLEDANSDPEAIKKRTLEAMAKFGQHGSLATQDRAAQAEESNAFSAVGRTIMSEWNTTVETSSIALKDFAKSVDDVKDSFSGLKDVLNSWMSNIPGHATPGFLPENGPLAPGLFNGQFDPSLFQGFNGASTGNAFIRPSVASEVPTPVRGWNTNPGTIPPDIASTAPTSPAPTSTEIAKSKLGDDIDLNSPEWAAHLDGLDREKGFPVGTMRGLAKTESGGQAGRHLGYHYKPDASGKRKSDASGIFGIKDSTALKPGYKIKPMAGPAFEQTPQEQARFASDFLANSIKLKGGNVSQGLAGYGEGTQAYADKVKQNSGTGLPDQPVPVTTAPDTQQVTPSNTSPGSVVPDVDLSGLNIEDRSNPNFVYGELATKNAQAFKGIVFHHTSTASLDNEVAYGKTIDKERGGAFGYHYYIDRDGKVVQGAPLDKRTNHIKPGSKTGLTNANALGVSLVGAKDGATPEQLAAAKKLGTAFGDSNNIDPKNIYGHGELQKDRMATEGVAAADQLRKDPKYAAAHKTSTGAPGKPDAPLTVATATQAEVPADTGTAKAEAPANTGPAKAEAPADTGPVKTEAPANTGPAKSEVPADTGPVKTEAPANTGGGTAAGKGGKMAVSGVDVPFLKDVPPPPSHQMTQEEKDLAKARDAEAARQAKDAVVPQGVQNLEKRLEALRQARSEKRAENESATGAPLPSKGAPNTELPSGDWYDANGNLMSKYAKREGSDPANLNKKPSDAPITSWRDDPGAAPAPAEASKEMGANKQAANFGSLDVTVNHTVNGVPVAQQKSSIKATSGSADNSVKGAITIGAPPAAGSVA